MQTHSASFCSVPGQCKLAHFQSKPSSLSFQRYLGAAVEVVCRGGVHEALLQVDAGVDAPREDQFSRGVDHFGSTRDHQLLSHLLDDAVLDVDIGLLGAVVVYHLAALYQDPDRR